MVMLDISCGIRCCPRLHVSASTLQLSAFHAALSLASARIYSIVCIVCMVASRRHDCLACSLAWQLQPARSPSAWRHVVCLSALHCMHLLASWHLSLHRASSLLCLHVGMVSPRACSWPACVPAYFVSAWTCAHGPSLLASPHPTAPVAAPFASRTYARA